LGPRRPYVEQQQVARADKQAIGVHRQNRFGVFVGCLIADRPDDFWRSRLPYVNDGERAAFAGKIRQAVADFDIVDTGECRAIGQYGVNTERAIVGVNEVRTPGQ
jgi:hypothetical protein